MKYYLLVILMFVIVGWGLNTKSVGKVINPAHINNSNILSESGLVHGDMKEGNVFSYKRV